MALHSNNAPDPAIGALAWPASRLGEAIHALARAAQLPTSCREAFAPPDGVTADQLDTWVQTAAERGGIQANRVLAGLDEIAALTLHAAPILIRITAAGFDGYFAIAGGRRHSINLVGPDLHLRRVRLETLEACVRSPFEAHLKRETEDLLDRMQVPARRRSQARARLLSERVKNVRLRSCWTLRLPPGAPLADQVRETHLLTRTALLVSAHVAQYALFIMAWWMLGQGVMSGTLDRGWLAGWLLLLVSLVPIRVLATGVQGVLSTTAGAGLRRQLLRGALRIDRESVKRQGAGQLFGVVVEGGAIESLALSGGVASCLAVVELAMATLVLWWAGNARLGALLILWIGGAGWLAWRYVAARRLWTQERLLMTNHLFEAMIGHRTRLAQQPSAQWHPADDMSLSRYLDGARTMDRAGIALSALVPRGWLVAALLVMTPAVTGHVSSGKLAATVGGILLAYRSLRRLSAGLSSAAGAFIAARGVLPLARAARLQPTTPHPSVVIPAPGDALSSSPVAYARGLMFRYAPGTEPVLDGCTLTVPHGARLLMEGPSGAGKTTFAQILAGLETPDSGLLLLDGLDRSVLGAAGWRQRVVMAPQAHDNYLVSGSLAFNLLMGRRWPAQHDDLVEAEQICRELGLGDLLDRLPGGLHQMVGETGWQLSQGERTRVFLARALLQKPELLVLDEGFSALDPENVDRTVRCVLRRAPSVLAIAHA